MHIFICILDFALAIYFLLSPLLGLVKFPQNNRKPFGVGTINFKFVRGSNGWYLSNSRCEIEAAHSSTNWEVR